MATITLSISSRTSKDTGKAEVLLRYRNTREVALRAHTHVFILPKFFADGQVVIKNRIMTDEVKDAHKAKAELDRIIGYVIEEGNKMAISSFTQKWAQETIDRLLFPENFKPKNEKHAFFDAAEDFINSHKVSASRIRSIRHLLGILTRYEIYKGITLDFETVTRETLLDFTNFCRNEHKFFDSKIISGKKFCFPLPAYKHIFESTPSAKAPSGRGENTITGIMRLIKCFWLWCLQMDYTTNNPFKNLKIKDQCYGTPYYMTIEERDKLYNTEITDSRMTKVCRDMFVFQCYLGCRAGDLLSLTKDNVIESERGTAIQYVPRKTKDNKPHTVKVYLTDTAITILKLYENNRTGFLFPVRSMGIYNKGLRRAMKIAEIDRIVTTRNAKTGESEQHRLCDVASSHMARRTFIGNLYKKVKDPNLVGKLSGHVEGSKAFARYRDIDDDMIRDMTNLLN